MAKTGVLLLHGLTGVASEMRPIEKYLQGLGYETEAPTLDGHGASEKEMLDSSAKSWIASADAALEKLAKRCDNLVVLGLSMGASISAILAHRHGSRISGLIMLSPTLKYDAMPTHENFDLRRCSGLVHDLIHVTSFACPWFGRTFYWTESPPYGLRDERLQRQITKALEAAKRGEETKFGLFRTHFLSLSNMNLVTDEFKNCAPEIRCPVFLISSLEDSLVSISNGTNAYAKLGSRNKSMAALTGCDHVMTLDLQRKYVCRLVGEFMEAVTGPSEVADTVIRKHTSGGLSVEVHNRLNPLSDMDWARLVPGSQPMADFTGLLQQKGVHESQCHTFVVRWDNEPVLMVPLVFLNRRLNVQLGLGAKLTAGFLNMFAPRLTQPNVALCGFSENAWGVTPPAGGDAEIIAKAWAAAEEMVRELAASHKCGVSAFVHSEMNNINAAKKNTFTKSRLQNWLAKQAILQPPGTQPTLNTRDRQPSI